MRVLLPFATILALAACTTPQTTLRNPATGQVVTCGGNTASSLAGGAVGYSIQRGADNRCVENYVAQGFVRIN
jgi:uncharacterized lipoprotein YajG